MRLHSIIRHLGQDATSGHYVTGLITFVFPFVISPDVWNGVEWTEFDDNRISTLTCEQLSRSTYPSPGLSSLFRAEHSLHYVLYLGTTLGKGVISNFEAARESRTFKICEFVAVFGMLGFSTSSRSLCKILPHTIKCPPFSLPTDEIREPPSTAVAGKASDKAVTSPLSLIIPSSSHMSQIAEKRGSLCLSLKETLLRRFGGSIINEKFFSVSFLALRCLELLLRAIGFP